MLNRRVFGTDPDLGFNEIPRRAILWQARPASMPLLPRMRPRTGELRLAGTTSALSATRKFRRETQTGVRERYLYIRLGQTYPLPQR